MISTIDKELHTFIKLLNPGQKKTLLSVIKSYLQPADHQTISIEQYNKELEDSEAEIDRGDYHTHEEVIKMSKNWTSGK